MGRREHILDLVLRRVSFAPCPTLPDPCWLWRGPLSGDSYKGQKKGRGHGYPRMSLEGVTVAVHRVMWMNDNGYLPPHKQLDHLCRNRACCNPAHLEPVTHKVNQRRRDKARDAK